jgi:uncharacterized protein YbjT (DUF2867 family)
MKFTITGSLGNVSKPLAAILIKKGHTVTVISSNKNKISEIREMGAIPAIGSIEDIAFLTKAFEGADAVYTMTPPNFSVPDYRAYYKRIGQNYATAIQAAHVKRVVNLSSVGAHLPAGTGPIAGLYDIEQLFNATDSIAVRSLRAGFFYTNFYGNIDMIKQANMIGSNYGEDVSMILVHPADIATAAAEELLQPFEGKSVRYVSSDERSTKEISSVLGKAIGKPELKWIAFSNEQALSGMTQAGFPETIAKTFVEMGDAVRKGILWEDYRQRKEVVSGRVKLEDFSIEFTHHYQSPQ